MQTLKDAGLIGEAYNRNNWIIQITGSLKSFNHSVDHSNHWDYLVGSSSWFSTDSVYFHYITYVCFMDNVLSLMVSIT